MTDEQFEALVAELDGEARRRPDAYRMKVLLLAMLGNGYLFAVVLLVFLMLAGLVASIYWLKGWVVKLVLIVGGFLLLVLRALWIRIEPPAGRPIGAGEAPELFALIDGLREQLRAPRFHEVLVTDDFNAGVVQSPRLGIFGWPRNYLLVGLPLMKSLTVEQFKAVLAHEFGHLARGHGRMSNWLYRQRLRWSRLMQALEEAQSGGSFLFKPFLNWFAPYFNAYSFPLARANEYEADATSARLTSPQAAAEALTGTSVVGAYLHERYWPQIYQQADHQPQPAFAPYRGMGSGLAAELEGATRETLVGRAMAEESTVADTHPALKDRLAAIGASPRFVPPSSGEAADRLLGSALHEITDEFDRRWKDAVQDKWEKRHREADEGRRELAELDRRCAAGESLGADDAFRRAMLTEALGSGEDAALAQLREAQARAPDSAPLCGALGVRLLARNEESGVALLERCAALDDDSFCECCAHIRDFYWRQGRQDEANAWHRRLVEREESVRPVAIERAGLTMEDKLEPHGLPQDAIEKLRAELEAIEGIAAAYLVRKHLRYQPERPLYVLAYKLTEPYRENRMKRAPEVQQRIRDGVSFPGQTLFFSLDAENADFEVRIKFVESSRFFRRA